MKAVFETTGQALHVSYLVMSQEARQGGPLRKALLQLMESLDNLTPVQTRWMRQLQGEASGTVNFGGLTGDEIRAQCAMVTQYVKDHLPAPEMHVVHARFIPTSFEVLGRDQEGREVKRFYFSQDRVTAIVGLAQFWSQSFPGISAAGLEMMIARAFVNHAKVSISLRELAASFGGNHMTYQRAYKVLQARLRELEANAVRRMTPHFEATGLVENALIDANS